MGAITKLSSKGQVVIPKAMREQMNLHTGEDISMEIVGDTIVLKKIPSRLDWSNLIDHLPRETVHMREDGSYDEEQSPHFHDWMVNG